MAALVDDECRAEARQVELVGAQKIEEIHAAGACGREEALDVEDRVLRNEAEIEPRDARRCRLQHVERVPGGILAGGGVGGDLRRCGEHRPPVGPRDCACADDDHRVLGALEERCE